MRPVFLRSCIYAFLAVASVGFIAPLLWLMLTSVKTQDEVYGNPNQWLPALPGGATGESAHAIESKDRLLIGRVKLLSKNGAEYEPQTDRVGQLWSHYGDGQTITSYAIGNGKQPSFQLQYAFKADNTVAVSAIVSSLPFSVHVLDGVQLDFQPDDSWNSIDWKIERQGAPTLVSLRSYPLIGRRPISQQWRLSEDRESLRIRNEIPLESTKIDRSKSESFRGEARLILLIHKENRLGAMWSKFRFHYDRVFSSIPFWQYFRTSVFLALSNSLLITLSSALVAFAFARMRWPGRDVWFMLLLATILFPPQVSLVPQFLIWKSIGGYNTLYPLWLPAAFGSAFFIFMLREALRSLPQDTENAARIDGCGLFGAFWHATLPQLTPSLAAIATFSFLASWNDFLGPLIFVADQRLYPLSFGTYALAVFSGNEPMLTAASALLLALPPIICFLILQRNIIRLPIRPALNR